MRVSRYMLRRTLLKLLAKPNTDLRLYKEYLPKKFAAEFPEQCQPKYEDFQTTKSLLENQGLAYVDESQPSHDNWRLVLTEDDGRSAARDITRHYLTEEERKEISIAKLKIHILLALYDAMMEGRRAAYPYVRENLLLTLYREPHLSGPRVEEYFRAKYSGVIESLRQEGKVTEEPITGGGSQLRLTSIGIDSVLGDSVGKSDGPDIQSVEDPRKVYVVHGRDSNARDAMFAFLGSIKLQPLEWSEARKATGKPLPYIGEILDKAFSIAQAVLVLMTPDDVACLREQFRNSDDPPHEIKLTGQARPNVLFEAGMAMGRYPDRTILVELGVLRPFSDIGGRYVIRLDNSPQRRQELAQCLESAGCPVDLSGTYWHTAGKFELSEADAGDPMDAKQQVATKLDTRRIQKLLERIENGEWDAVRLLFDYLEEEARDNSAYKKYEESLKNWDNNELQSRVNLASRRFDTSSLSSEEIKSLAYTYCKRTKDSRTSIGAFRNPKYSDFRRIISSYLREILEDILRAS